MVKTVQKLDSGLLRNHKKKSWTLIFGQTWLLTFVDDISNFFGGFDLAELDLGKWKKKDEMARLG